MSEPELGLGPSTWPPEPLITERLALTERRPADREHLVELWRSEPVWRYLGGPYPREQAERVADGPGRPGAFVIRRHPTPEGGAPEGETPGGGATESGGHGFVGYVGFQRRSPDQPGHVEPALEDTAGWSSDGSTDLPAGELELSYLLHPDAWGQGFGYEAARAALGWAASVFTDTLVVAVTQAANERSIRMLRRLGFTERDRFEQFGAEQSLNAAPLATYRS